MATEQTEYRGFTISFVHDDHTENPFKDYVDHIRATIATPAYRGYDESEYNGGVDLPDLTRDEIKQNTKAILKLTGTKSLHNLIAKHSIDFNRDYQTAVDGVNDAILQFVVDQPAKGDKYDSLAMVWRMKGAACISVMGTGYSQGDFHYGLFLLHPDDAETADIPEPMKHLYATAELYRDWAYNDVYGYQIRESNDCPNGGDHCPCCKAYAVLDSCYGFSGAYDSEGYLYMVKSAKEAVDESLKQLNLNLHPRPAEY